MNKENIQTSKEGTSFFKTVGMMTAIMLVGKVLGLFRGILHTAIYGTGSVEGTAFYYASLIPRQFLDIVFSAVISASFIPVFNGYLEKKGREAAFHLANSFLSIIIFLSSIITLVSIAFTPQIFSLMGGGVEQGVFEATTFLLKIMFPTIVLAGIAFSLIGVLQALGEFNIPAAMSVTSNGIIIFYYVFLLEKFGVLGLCFAFLAGWLSQILIQIPFLVKNGFKFRFTLKLGDTKEGLIEIFKLMLPVMVSTWVVPINFAVNQKAAAHLFGGNTAGLVLGNANELYSVITGVFVLSLANVIFPKLSKLYANENSEEFGKSVSGALSNLFFLLIPMTVGLMLLSTEIIRLFYQYGEFNDFSTQAAAKALFYFAPGMLGFGLQTVCLRAFYAVKNGRTPLITGIFAIAVNFVLSFALVDKLDVGGVALASSVSVSVAAVILLGVLFVQFKSLSLKDLLVTISKMLSSAVVMGVLVFLIKSWLMVFLKGSFFGTALIVGLSALVGSAAYFLMSFFLGINEARFLFGLINALLVKVKVKKGEIHGKG